MYQFLFTNSQGESIYLNYESPFILERVDGLSSIPVDTQGEKAPYQDGNTYIDSVLDVRTLSFICQVRGTDIETNRRKAIRVLNPKLGVGSLSFTNTRNGITRTLDCVVDGVPNFLDDHDNRRPTMERFTFDLVANNPLWKGDAQTWTLASFIGGFQFPWSFPLSFGTVGTDLLLTNDGDSDAPLFITLTGPLTNPLITNETTGEFIKLTQNLLAGYKLEINTAMGSKDVTIISNLGVRSNGFQYLSPDSTLFELGVGTTELSYVADFQPSAVAVQLIYNPRYIGV